MLKSLRNNPGRKQYIGSVTKYGNILHPGKLYSYDLAFNAHSYNLTNFILVEKNDPLLYTGECLEMDDPIFPDETHVFGFIIHDNVCWVDHYYLTSLKPFSP